MVRKLKEKYINSSINQLILDAIYEWCEKYWYDDIIHSVDEIYEDENQWLIAWVEDAYKYFGGFGDDVGDLNVYVKPSTLSIVKEIERNGESLIDTVKYNSVTDLINAIEQLTPDSIILDWSKRP